MCAYCSSMQFSCIIAALHLGDITLQIVIAIHKIWSAFHILFPVGLRRLRINKRIKFFCKRSSVNCMAAGSRLSWCIMDFSPVCNFSNTVLNSTSLAGCRTWCPTDLQHLYCKAKNKHKQTNKHIT